MPVLFERHVDRLDGDGSLQHRSVAL